MIFILEVYRWKIHTFIKYYEFLCLRSSIMDFIVTMYWYNSCWSLWLCLTYNLYFNSKFRDLGPSHQVFDYHDEIQMGFYLTLGFRLIISWTVWTYIADIVFMRSIFFFIHKFFLIENIRWSWYNITLCSCIEVRAIYSVNSIYNTNMFIWFNLDNLTWLDQHCKYYETSKFWFNLSKHIITPENKTLYLWFPWMSFFNYISIFGLFYIITLLSIYNSENSYYTVLYTVFLLFLFSANLVILDLDIFAGLLLLIESVVILMLFFLIIYLSPNIASTVKNNRWKLYLSCYLIIFILSIYSYPNLGMEFFNTLSIPFYIYDDFYEAMQELGVNDLMGIFLTFYITDSLLFFLLGIFLLVASIICVVIVSFFTKTRNYSFKNFLNIFSILKTCYSFIFLRKQNLSTQGKSSSSTRVFSKKIFDSNSHKEYREKYEIFEQKKKDAKKSKIDE